MDANARHLAAWLVREIDATESRATLLQSMPRMLAFNEGQRYGLRQALARLAMQWEVAGPDALIADVRAWGPELTDLPEGDRRHATVGPTDPALDRRNISEGENRALDGNR